MPFYNFKLYLRDRVVGWLFLLALLGQIFMWWYLLVNIHPSNEPIFLHYNMVFGIDLVGSWRRIFYLPAGGLLIFFLNYFISWYFYSQDKFLARLLSFWSTLLQFFLALAVWLIVGLNI